MVYKVVPILLSRGYDGCRGSVGVTDLHLIYKTRERTSDIRREVGILATYNQKVLVGSVLESLPYELC